ncbi:hypothetical protein HK102_009353, partial [Quaeritorhiza haematococci]
MGPPAQLQQGTPQPMYAGYHPSQYRAPSPPPQGTASPPPQQQQSSSSPSAPSAQQTSTTPATAPTTATSAPQRPYIRNYVDDNERILQQAPPPLLASKDSDIGGAAKEEKERKGKEEKEKMAKRVAGAFAWAKRKGQNDSKLPPDPARRVFGVPLEQAVAVSKVSENYALPAVVYRCIEYLDAKKAAEEEGIYRLSGSATVINGLKDRFNNGDMDLLGSGEYYDVHAIAGLLKLFLRELPTPVLTKERQRDFLNVTDLLDRNDRIAELARLVSLLPLANYTLLRALIAHLIRIVQNCELNKMTVRNIGIVFAPTLSMPAGVFTLMMAEYKLIFCWDDSDPERGRAAKEALAMREQMLREREMQRMMMLQQEQQLQMQQQEQQQQQQQQQGGGSGGNEDGTGTNAAGSGENTSVESVSSTEAPGARELSPHRRDPALRARRQQVGMSLAPGAFLSAFSGQTNRNSISYMDGVPDAIRMYEEGLQKIEVKEEDESAEASLDFLDNSEESDGNGLLDSTNSAAHDQTRQGGFSGS